MTNTPLTSGDQSKLLVFVLLMLPTLPFIIGIIPSIFLLFGVIMMKRSSDFSHIEAAARNFRLYAWLGVFIAAGFFLYGAVEASDWDRDDYFTGSGVIFAVAIFYQFAVHFLFLQPLQAHADWVVANGIFAGKSKAAPGATVQKDISIIGGEKLKSFSVADELLKWAKLKEDGLITEAEFDDARKKLLQRA